MRVLFAVVGWPTHYYPMVPFAWACRAAGHDVRVASPPSLVDTVVTSGLPAVAVGQDSDMAGKMRRKLSPLQDPVSGRLNKLQHWSASRAAGLAGPNGDLQALHAAAAATMVDDLVAFARRWRPDIVVWDATSYAGGIAARSLGVPSVRMLFGPDIIAATGLEDDWLPEFRTMFERYGVPADRGLADASLDPTPPSLQVPGVVHPIPMQVVPYNGPAVQPDWTLDPPERTRLCVTWGTSTGRITSAGTFLVPQIIDAVADLDIEIVLTVNALEHDAIGPLPDNVRLARSLPLHLVLAGCSAVIHQGGGGTFLTAARYGLPQVMITQVPDQVLNAVNLVAAGAGRNLSPHEATTARIREDAELVLADQSYSDAAALVRAEILDLPTPGEIAADLRRITDAAMVGSP
jgi:glycosyltransferase